MFLNVGMTRFTRTKYTCHQTNPSICSGSNMAARKSTGWRWSMKRYHSITMLHQEAVRTRQDCTDIIRTWKPSDRYRRMEPNSTNCTTVTTSQLQNKLQNVDIHDVINNSLKATCFSFSLLLKNEIPDETLHKCFVISFVEKIWHKNNIGMSLSFICFVTHVLWHTHRAYTTLFYF